MKYRHVFWAIVLIAIGVLFMLNNFGVIEFGFWAFWSLWPLILILWGISILPIRDSIKVIALVAVLALTVIFFERLSENSFLRHIPFRHWEGNNWQDEGSTDEEPGNYQPQNLSVPLDSALTKGVLELEAAAGNFNIEGTTSDFLSFSKTGDIGDYSLTTNDEGQRKRIVLSLEKSGIRHNVDQNKVDIKLNQKPSWNLDLDIGAAEINMDLRDYKIDSTTINAGASSIKIQVGDKAPVSVLSFNAGASSITVDVPRASGCQITSESFMVSKEFSGFTKTGNGIYQTDNFKTSPNKVMIVVKTAVSKIEVNRY
jgi:hypothetical protein